MPVTDSLLLDPPKIDVWFALRADGVKGTGTEEDPCNGSASLESAFTVTQLTRSGREATASTGGTNHNYSNGDDVTIAGVTGSGSQYYNGTFTIYSVTPNTFKYWMKADPGADGSGTMTSARTHFPFDDIRGTILAYLSNITIRLGPGVFQTKGISFSAGGVPVFSGQKVIG